MKQLDQPIVFFDLETTGISTSFDKIVQFAGIKVLSNGERLTYTTLINPGIPIPLEASQVHGIYDEMVVDALSFEEIAGELYEWMSGSVIAGYNSNNFDVPLLCAEFERCGILWPSSDACLVDVLSIERKLTSHKLTDTYRRYTGQELIDAHDALSDAQATLEVFHHQMQLLDHCVGLDDLIHRCNDGVERYDIAGKMYQKEGVVYWNFGKHKHKPVHQDLDYCNWVMLQDFPAQTKSRLKQYIESSQSLS